MNLWFDIMLILDPDVYNKCTTSYNKSFRTGYKETPSDFKLRQF